MQYKSPGHQSLGWKVWDPYGEGQDDNHSNSTDSGAPEVGPCNISKFHNTGSTLGAYSTLDRKITLELTIFNKQKQ